jgi:hypothetical protein
MTIPMMMELSIALILVNTKTTKIMVETILDLVIVVINMMIDIKTQTITVFSRERNIKSK